MKKMTIAALVAAVAVVVMSSCEGSNSSWRKNTPEPKPEIAVDNSDAQWIFTETVRYREIGTFEAFVEIEGVKKNEAGEIIATADLPRTKIFEVYSYPTESFVKGTCISNQTEDTQLQDETIEECEGFKCTKKSYLYTLSSSVYENKIESRIGYMCANITFTDPETGEVVYEKNFEGKFSIKNQTFSPDNNYGSHLFDGYAEYEYITTYRPTFKVYLNEKEVCNIETNTILWCPTK